MQPKFKIDRREFDKAWREYRRFNRRDLAETINTKLFFIARRAVIETPKANKSQIKITRKTGAVLGRIINKRRGQRGERGLYGDEMSKAVETIVAARKRSVAFLKSGWIPAIKKLEPYVKSKRGVARNDSSAKQVGKPKGTGHVAKPGIVVSGSIINAIGTAGKRASPHNAALLKFGSPALQRAFDSETKSMRDYIAAKMKKTAALVGIKTR